MAGNKKKKQLSGRSGSCTGALDRIKPLKGQDHVQPHCSSLSLNWAFWERALEPKFLCHPHSHGPQAPIRMSLSNINAQRPAILEGLHKTV